MNKIVLEHYPVNQLPEDIRKVVGDAVSVTVTVEEERPASATVHEFVRQLREDLANRTHGVTVEEATQRIRTLRDEWDD